MTEKRGREIKTRHCKKCGKPFESQGYYKNICKECKQLQMKTTVLNYSQNTDYLKWKWTQKKGNITLKLATKARWIEDAWDPYTTERCATCNKEHFSKEKYDHLYSAFFIKDGINTEDIPELLCEYCSEKCNKKTQKKETKRFLKRRNL